MPIKEGALAKDMIDIVLTNARPRLLGLQIDSINLRGETLTMNDKPGGGPTRARLVGTDCDEGLLCSFHAKSRAAG